MKSGNAFLVASVLLLSGLASIAVLWMGGPDGRTGFPLDDAWIHLVYGRSVSEQGYLAYNSGKPATGSTSPLWAYVLGLIHLIFSSPVLVVQAVKITGISAHLLMTYLAYRIVTRFAHSSFWGAISALFLGLSPFLVVTGLSGMEVSLGCALSLGGVWAYLNARYGLAGLMLGLSGITRPEYGLIAFAVAAELIFHVWKGRTKFMNFVALAAPVVLCAGMYLGWNLAIDGKPFPATYYVKSMPGGAMSLFDRTVYGFQMISKTAPLKGGFVWIALLGMLRIGRELRRAVLLFLFSGILYDIGNLIMIPPFDTEAFYHIRYLLPSVPFLFIALSISGVSGSRTILRQAHGGEARSKRNVYALVVAAVVSGSVAVYTLTGLKYWAIKFGRDCRNINEVQVELGRAVSRGFDEQARIGTTDAGAVRYFGQRFTLDLMGLNSNIPLSADCRTDALDALVLMPAWVEVSDPKSLVPIAHRQTKDYHVTSNSRMNHQVLVVSRCDAGRAFHEYSIRLLRKPAGLCLKCFDETAIGRLREATKVPERKILPPGVKK